MSLIYPVLLKTPRHQFYDQQDKDFIIHLFNILPYTIF